MSYWARETSDHDGQPLELYRFALGERVWLFTSADEELDWEDETYEPVYIKRGGFTKGGDSHKSTIELEVRPDHPVALLFRTGWLSGQVVVTIYRLHRGDNESTVLWKGRVNSCKWQNDVAVLSSDSAYTLFQNAGLRRIYQVACPHVLYSSHCGVIRDDWRMEGTVAEVADNRIKLGGAAASAPAGYFKGGMILFGTELRMIVIHAEGWITLVDGIDLAEGDTIELWPGCAHTVAACKNKFGNLVNYGGLPFLPNKNPFSGDALA